MGGLDQGAMRAWPDETRFGPKGTGARLGRSCLIALRSAASCTGMVRSPTVAAMPSESA